MFVDLPAGVHCDHVADLCVPVHDEQDAPTANAELAHPRTFGERSREPWIEGVFGELDEANADALLRRMIETVQRVTVRIRIDRGT